MVDFLTTRLTEVTRWHRRRETAWQKQVEGVAVRGSNMLSAKVFWKSRPTSMPKEPKRFSEDNPRAIMHYVSEVGAASDGGDLKSNGIDARVSGSASSDALNCTVRGI